MGRVGAQRVRSSSRVAGHRCWRRARHSQRLGLHVVEISRLGMLARRLPTPDRRPFARPEQAVRRPRHLRLRAKKEVADLVDRAMKLTKALF